MNSNFEVKPIEENFFYWVHFLTIKLFNNTHYRRIRLFVLILHSSIVCAHIYFCITLFNTDFLFQYIAGGFGLVASIFFNASFFVTEKIFTTLEDTIYSHFWSPSSTTKDVEDGITRDCKYVTYTVVLNTFLGIFAGIVVVPCGEALNHQFAIFFFRTYLPYVHYIFDAIFLLSFVVTGHVAVNWANVVAYYSYLAIGQVHLAIEVIKHWSAGYEDQDDNSLFYSVEYQRVLKERIRTSIIRHVELLRLFRIVSGAARQLLPLLTLGGISMCLSAISFVYFEMFNLDLLYWRYFQHLVWATSSLITGTFIIHSGQQLEDQTGNLFDIMNDVRWITFNESNKRSLLLFLTVAQIPCRLQFSDSLSVNYELGISMVRNVYSFAAILARVTDFSI